MNPLFKGPITQRQHKKQGQTLQAWSHVDKAELNDNAKIVLKLLKKFQKSFYDMSSDLYFQWYDPNALSYAHNRNIDLVQNHHETTPKMVQAIVEAFQERGWVEVVDMMYTPDRNSGSGLTAKAKGKKPTKPMKRGLASTQKRAKLT